MSLRESLLTEHLDPEPIDEDDWHESVDWHESDYAREKSEEYALEVRIGVDQITEEIHRVLGSESELRSILEDGRARQLARQLVEDAWELVREAHGWLDVDGLHRAASNLEAVLAAIEFERDHGDPQRTSIRIRHDLGPKNLHRVALDWALPGASGWVVIWRLTRRTLGSARRFTGHGREVARSRQAETRSGSRVLCRQGPQRTGQTTGPAARSRDRHRVGARSASSEDDDHAGSSSFLAGV